MADNRFNQVPGYGGSGGFHVGQQNSSMNGMPGMAAYMQGGMQVNPMVQQQMMMASRMRSPMQGMQMSVPATPPPPYSVHTPNPGVTTIPNRPRTSLNKPSEGQQSEKARYFEEQRQKLRLFGKPGTVTVDADKLIGSMFAADVRTQQSKTKSNNSLKSQDDDDGFGDFLQGPSTPAVTGQRDHQAAEHSIPQLNSQAETVAEPKLENFSEKKDLKSIMLEYSDLSAPKKAKGFHKLTLNEVQKSGPGHHKVVVPNFHQSDHSRSWKQHTEDLEGLFHLPVLPKQPAVPVYAVSADAQHLAYTQQNVMAASLPTTNMTAFSPGSLALVPPSGQPPSYNDVVGSTTSPTSHTAMIASTSISPPGTGDYVHSSARPIHFPDWCSYTEDQLPPVYKQVLEASLIDGKISTDRLYPILLFSGLPREKLAQIWTLCNSGTPGQLTKNELWMVLALIALSQNNYSSSSLDILARCPVAPVPFLAQMQDTSAPATLPIAPQQHQSHPPQHQSHPPQQSPIAQIASPASSNAALPSSTSHQQAHTIQHSRLQSHKPSLTPVVTTSSKNGIPSDDVDDDFADFQTATLSTNAVSVGKDEVFGEFIGGGGLGSCGFSLPPRAVPVPVYNHVGNGSVVMGNGSLQSLHHQQQQPELQQKPASVLLASLPVDDKYGTNVRSFFCSSDSSAGSPSFEDDDFTDGRDSLSQVSTSEQSENEDIRNFENYVEEYNQQKEKPGASPLHCPFPALQQNPAAVGTKRHSKPSSHVLFGDTHHSDKDAAMPKRDLGSSSTEPVHGSHYKNTYAGFSRHGSGGVGSSVIDVKNTVDTFKVSAPIATSSVSLRSISELADSKLTSLQTVVTSNVVVSHEELLIGDEDKYSALRVLSFDSDLPQHPVIEGHGRLSGHSTTGSSNNNEASLATSVVSEDDDWADFSASPAVIEDHHMSPSSSAAQKNETTTGLKKPTGSLFEDDPNSTSTPSKGWSEDLSVSRDHLSVNKWNDQNSGIADLGWNKNVVGSGSDFESNNTDYGSDDGRYHRSEHVMQTGSPNDSSINRLSASGLAVNAGLSSGSLVSPSFRLDLDNKLKYEDDWQDFPHKSLSSSVDVQYGKLSQNALSRENINDARHSDIKTNADEDDWCDFSSVGVEDVVPKDGVAAGVGVDETDGGSDSKGKFVTIKKQNLGTVEIMGLFKVRDDPATLSSYQLPTQQSVNRSSASHGQVSHRPGGSTYGHRRSSDYDEDFGPPPMDFAHDDDYDDHSYSRGYDLDDFMQSIPPTTTYSPFGVSHAGPVYSRAGGVSKLKESKEDSGSVHSLDLPSNRPTSSDSQSVSSADLTSGEMTGGVGVVSAESKSLDSLDLRSDNGDMDNSDGAAREGVQVFGSTSQHQPIQPQELLATMPDFADRYNIEREAQGSDRYGYEWERCLSNCCRIISEANTLFNMIDSSSVCNEVLKSSQGSEYVTCIIEIYRVVCRVLTSMRVTAISTTELEQMLKNIDIAWNNLTAFLVGTSVLPEETSLVFTNCILKLDMEHSQSSACGLCLLNVDARPLTSSSKSGGIVNINSCKLTYAGRQYHAACANFWVNCVDQTLPSLTLPDLL